MKQKVIFDRKCCEYSQTLGVPVALENSDHQLDLNERSNHILSYDDWRPVTAQRYTVQEVEIPEWLTFEDYKEDHIYIDSFLKFEKVEALTNEHAVKVFRLWRNQRISKKEAQALVKLLATKTFKSEFRRSLYNQVVSWFVTPTEEKKFSLPLSNKQFEAITRYER